MIHRLGHDLFRQIPELQPLRPQSLQFKMQGILATLTIELPDNLQAALRAQANAQGVSEEGYIRRVLQRDLAAPPPEQWTPDRDILQRSERAAERIRELHKGNILPEGDTRFD
jgi:plasmid stability protein